MALSAVGHVAASQIGSAPSGMGGDYNGEILMLLVSSAGIIFIDHARSGQPQPGDQYAALGITGFILLFLGQFWPEVAFAFTVLILVSIILNSPNGIPFIGKNSGGNSTGINPTLQGTGEAPGINAVGGSTSGTGVQGPVTPSHPLNPAQ